MELFVFVLFLGEAAIDTPASILIRTLGEHSGHHTLFAFLNLVGFGSMAIHSTHSTGGLYQALCTDA